MKMRCNWAKSEILINYHDNRWGIPLYDDFLLFNLLCLESFQAGLSWEIILKKEKDLNNSFDNFNPKIVANYDETKINELLSNPLIIRNKLKINAMINNAKMFNKHFNDQSFSDYIWKYNNFLVIDNQYKEANEIPTISPLSIKISNNLKKLGFKFVGPTIIYSFLEAMGLYNNHLEKCFKKRK